MENIKAKIKLLDSFLITGRGLVFSIEILEGEVLSGSLIHFTLNNKPYQLKIRGVELSSRRTNPILSGILLEVSETEFQELYHNPQLQGIIAKVI